MRSVKLTMLRKFDRISILFLLMVLLFPGLRSSLHAQNNSPFSRYGLGDRAPGTNIMTRGMGGVSAASNDYFNINYSNPATYAFFYSTNEEKSRKLSYGRAVLNIGVNYEGRRTIDPGTNKSFTSNNIIFSNVGLGLPLRKNWGLAFGLRPVHAIDYKLIDSSQITDAATGRVIDKGQTLYEGTGGLNLGYFGTGVKFKTGENSFLGLGMNGGYMFGKKDYTTRRSIHNDSINYANGFRRTKTALGGLYFDAGVQYQFKISSKMYLGLGAFGNWQQKLNATRDQTAGTYVYSSTSGYAVVDTVLNQSGIKGNLIYPAEVTAGFLLQKPQDMMGKESGWLVGIDFTRNNWDQYRFYGQPDSSVKSNWTAKFGAELRPARKANYFSNAAYRFGVFTGPDYIYPSKTLSTYGLTVGMGLPLANYNQQAKGQASQINLAFEYIKRGSNSNVMKEDLYRLSVGFSLTDFWFIKRRYE